MECHTGGSSKIRFRACCSFILKYHTQHPQKHIKRKTLPAWQILFKEDYFPALYDDYHCSTGISHVHKLQFDSTMTFLSRKLHLPWAKLLVYRHNFRQWPFLYSLTLALRIVFCVCHSAFEWLTFASSNVRFHQRKKEGETYSPREAEIIETKYKLDQLIAVADLELKEEKLNRLDSVCVFVFVHLHVLLHLHNSQTYCFIFISTQ